VVEEEAVADLSPQVLLLLSLRISEQ
jgi:hypothetical protein